MQKIIRAVFGEKDHLLRRYAVFFLGLVICSFGVAASTKAGLGTSPVTAIPYSLSLIFPRVSFGNWLIFFCLALIPVQIILLRKNCVVSELVIQAVLTFAYGYLTDFSMLILRAVPLGSYLARIALLLAGCAVLAFGVYLELLSDVAMMPPDAFIKAVAQAAKKPYPSVKIVTDVSMSALGAVLCLSLLGTLSGVREGTAIAAFLVGFIMKIFQRIFERRR